MKQSKDCEKIFADRICDQGLVSRMCEDPSKHRSKSKQSDYKIGYVMNRPVTEEDTQMSNMHIPGKARESHGELL